MNESEWLESSDPLAMLRVLQMPIVQFVASDRKFRLFSCACALASATRIAGTAYEQMLVDGQAPIGNFEYGHDPKRLAEIWCEHDGLEALMLSRHRPSRHPAKAARADLIRHIFGNPWRRMLVQDRWPRLVEDMAQVLYDGDQSAAGPLHDALLDCGLDAVAEHFAETWLCPQCGGAGEYDDVGHEDLDGLGGIAAIVRCERCVGGRVPMVQEYNDGGTSYWFNLLEPNTRHLTPERAQPKHPKGCWAIDLILGKE